MKTAALSCAELVARLNLALDARGAWAFMIVPEHRVDDVVEELCEAWRFSSKPIEPEVLALEEDARPLLSRCDETSQTVFIVRIPNGSRTIAEQLESERSRWLLARGGVFVAEEASARALLASAPNTVSVLASNIVLWQRDSSVQQEA